MIVRTTPSPLSTVVAAPRPSVAALCLTTANFHPGNDGSGHLEITDPPVVEQKSGNAPATIAADTVLEVKMPDSGELTFAGPTGTLWLDMAWTFTGKVADFGTEESIDLPGIGFGAHLTLGYSKNSNETSGILAVKDGTQIANGNYMATSFVTAADGHGGTLAHGVIGLFVGPIVLSVAWQLLIFWLDEATEGSTSKIDLPQPLKSRMLSK
jgi:hypothetical protein